MSAWSNGLDEQDVAIVEGALGHFGIPTSALDGRRVFRANVKTLWLTLEDERAPSSPSPDARGMPLIHTTMAVPKLTTVAAQVLAPHATRYVVELDRAQVAGFLSRERVSVRAEQVDALDGTGYVLAHHEGVWLGVGLWRAGRPDELESFFPKWLSNEPGVSAFGEASR